MSDLRIAYLHNRLVYVLHIPLLTPGTYKVYKYYYLQDKNLTLINSLKLRPLNYELTNVKYIGLNKDADIYYEFQEGELHRAQGHSRLPSYLSTEEDTRND